MYVCQFTTGHLPTAWVCLKSGTVSANLKVDHHFHIQISTPWGNTLQTSAFNHIVAQCRLYIYIYTPSSNSPYLLGKSPGCQVTTSYYHKELAIYQNGDYLTIFKYI